MKRSETSQGANLFWGDLLVLLSDERNVAATTKLSSFFISSFKSFLLEIFLYCTLNRQFIPHSRFRNHVTILLPSITGLKPYMSAYTRNPLYRTRE